MSAETAEWVLVAITAVGAIAWLAGLRFLAASFPPRLDLDGRAADRFEMPESKRQDSIRGSVEVEGTPAELAAKAAAVLAEKSAASTGPLKIVECDADRVVFEGAPQAADTHSPGRFLRQGELRFRYHRSNRTRIDYTIDVSGGRGLLVGGMVFQILGLVALGVGFWLIHTYVVSNPVSAIRWQTIQMVQVVHFLWPPFLMGALYRRGRSTLRGAVETMVHNLPYHGT